jgi:hypothetical protein
MIREREGGLNGLQGRWRGRVGSWDGGGRRRLVGCLGVVQGMRRLGREHWGMRRLLGRRRATLLECRESV